LSRVLPPFRDSLTVLSHLSRFKSKEVPLPLSMVFAQHKRLMELEKRMKETPKAG
jgi:hypothetical protein